MKHARLFIAALLSLILSSTSVGAENVTLKMVDQATVQKPGSHVNVSGSIDYVPGEILIKFKDGTPNPGILNAAQSIGGQRIKVFSEI